MSSATAARPAAASRAISHAAPTTCSTVCPVFCSFSRFAPNVFVLKISQPAAAYSRWMARMTSRRSRFHSSGSAPPARPCACRSVPMPPSKITTSFPNRSIT